jgi:hypothetical protein
VIPRVAGRIPGHALKEIFFFGLLFAGIHVMFDMSAATLLPCPVPTGAQNAVTRENRIVRVARLCSRVRCGSLVSLSGFLNRM